MKKLIKNGICALGFSVFLAMTPITSQASGHGHGHGAAEAVKSLTPAETMKTIIEGNDKFKAEHDSHHFDSFQNGQTPNITFITCSDSRVHTHLFGMEPDNHEFVIRNVGNQIGNSEGSVDYGIHHLPTKVLVVLGHSSCGAIKAAMGDYSKETPGIKKELEPLKPVLAHDDGQGSFKERWAENVERNVDYQVNYSLKLYGDQVKSGDLAIVGAVYDFNNNYGKGRGTLVVTNVNGETDIEKIIDDPLFKDIPTGDVVNHVGSLAPAVNW